MQPRRKPLDRIANVARNITNEEERNKVLADYKVEEPGLTRLVADLMAKPVSAHNSVVLVEALQGQFSLNQSILDVKAELKARLLELQYNDMLALHQAGQYEHKRGALFTPNRTQQVTEAAKFGNRR